jgi:hypothetical protein
MLPCLLIFCTGKNQPAVPEVTIRLDVREGQTVFELLEAQHEVEYDRTSMGIFVKAIDGIKNEKGHYWIYYLNGQPGRVACDKATVFDGDTVVWKYSKSGS